MFKVELPPADIVDGLIVHHEGTVGVLQGGVGGQNSIVRLNDSSGNLWGRVDGELKLALLAIVHRQPLHEQGSESGSGASSEGMEEKESLESSTSVRQLPDTVKNEVDNLLSDGVVSSGVVVGRILLSLVLGICIKYQVNWVLWGIEILIGYSPCISLISHTF